MSTRVTRSLREKRKTQISRNRSDAVDPCDVAVFLSDSACNNNRRELQRLCPSCCIDFLPRQYIITYYRIGVMLQNLTKKKNNYLYDYVCPLTYGTETYAARITNGLQRKISISQVPVEHWSSFKGMTGTNNVIMRTILSKLIAARRKNCQIDR